jgi:hypothetical protein
MYVEYKSNKNGYSGSSYIHNPYFKTFYLKWVEARKLPQFIFIMLCFKTVVATTGDWPTLPASHNRLYACLTVQLAYTEIYFGQPLFLVFF